MLGIVVASLFFFQFNHLSAYASDGGYQNTSSYANPNGAISLDQYSQAQLNELATIASGDNQFSGNTCLSLAATEHVHVKDLGYPYRNIVGPDGIYKLYNESTFMSDSQVEFAAEYWNKLAGKKLVEIVHTKAESDQVIHDEEKSKNGKPLGMQTYSRGIEIYPNNWDVLAHTETNLDLQKVATLIHEIGHGLGIPHLGGGYDGGNSAVSELFGAEVMALWAPTLNPNGIVSTKEDAATLALAGLTYEKPMKLASWVLENDSYQVSYLPTKVITSTVPVGVEIYFPGNYLNKKMIANASGKIVKNYNVYTVDDTIIENQELGEAVQDQTTLYHNMIDKEVTITTIYTSNYEKLSYYRFEFNGNPYVADSSAFETKLEGKGISIDSPENYIDSYEAINEEITITKIYNVYTFSDVTLENTFIDTAEQVGTTEGLGIKDKTVVAASLYSSNKGQRYYGFYHEGNYYVVNAASTL